MTQEAKIVFLMFTVMGWIIFIAGWATNILLLGFIGVTLIILGGLPALYHLTHRRK